MFSILCDTSTGFQFSTYFTTCCLFFIAILNVFVFLFDFIWAVALYIIFKANDIGFIWWSTSKSFPAISSIVKFNFLLLFHFSSSIYYYVIDWMHSISLCTLHEKSFNHRSSIKCNLGQRISHLKCNDVNYVDGLYLKNSTISWYKHY